MIQYEEREVDADFPKKVRAVLDVLFAGDGKAKSSEVTAAIAVAIGCISLTYEDGSPTDVAKLAENIAFLATDETNMNLARQMCGQAPVVSSPKIQS